MKINSGVHSIHTKNVIQDTASNAITGQKSFAAFMSQQSELKTKEHLQNMLKQIEHKGLQLTKSLTIRDLHEYKRYVQQFLDAVIRQGIGIKKTRGFNRRGREKRYMIIEEIDRHLLDLTDQFILDESRRIELLERIGEIKGLLINLLY